MVKLSELIREEESKGSIGDFDISSIKEIITLIKELQKLQAFKQVQTNQKVQEVKPQTQPQPQQEVMQEAVVIINRELLMEAINFYLKEIKNNPMAKVMSVEQAITQVENNKEFKEQMAKQLEDVIKKVVSFGGKK